MRPSIVLWDFGDTLVDERWMLRPAPACADWPKVALCDIALERLGCAGDRANALLVDNRTDIVDAWREAGGLAYHYRGDEQFARDRASLL